MYYHSMVFYFYRTSMITAEIVSPTPRNCTGKYGSVASIKTTISATDFRENFGSKIKKHEHKNIRTLCKKLR